MLRHWETVGLLRPARDVGGRRCYGPDDLSRIAVIVRGKEAGIGLDELKAILDADPDARLRLLQAHHAELDRRITAIQASQRLTRHAVDCEAGDFTTCPNFQALAREVIGDGVPA
ncbi:DNA-binding transcriptional MerR regulator [Modestobacter versicolor]|uniref:DNA-binding transcriptional MerR regulator n=1 Tax=Modestobacter versicolor TaxID=429133 RepID=A0A839Y4J5_9ACTN|nr:DNA-binding transcriptional MerR regulator [Modestobacter versicolor]